MIPQELFYSLPIHFSTHPWYDQTSIHQVLSRHICRTAHMRSVNEKLNRWKLCSSSLIPWKTSSFRKNHPVCHFICTVVGGSLAKTFNNAFKIWGINFTSILSSITSMPASIFLVIYVMRSCSSCLRSQKKIHHIQNVFQGCIESNGGWEKYEHITVSQIPR